MADFATHLGWGTVGAGLAASATYAADIVPAGDLITLTTAGLIGSVLPDIDLEKAVPSRLLFTGLGFLLAFVVLFNFKASYSVTELWIIWLAVFALIRFGAYHLFHRTAVHRGIFHSLLAALFFMVMTAVLLAYTVGREPIVAWMAGLFVFFGFVIHLVLDEIYSVDFTGARIKRSFGSALKLYDSRSVSGSALMAGALILVLMISPPSAEFRRIMQPAQVTQFFKQRMFPQNGWFQSRPANMAATPGPQRSAAANAPADRRAE
jgi:hypothetical protein